VNLERTELRLRPAAASGVSLDAASAGNGPPSPFGGPFPLKNWAWQLGIPVSFTGTTTDLTTHTVLGSFIQAKGQGKGMHNQSAVTCSSPPQIGTAAELGLTGVNPTDMIEFDFSAQVVLKP
jgi:hypothetical protein